VVHILHLSNRSLIHHLQFQTSGNLSSYFRPYLSELVWLFQGFFWKFEIEDDESDSDYSDEEYEPPKPRKSLRATEPKTRGGKDSYSQNMVMSKKEEAMMMKLERMEGILSQLSNAKSKAMDRRSKSSHKTVIVTPQAQYMPERRVPDPKVEKMKQSLLNDMF